MSYRHHAARYLASAGLMLLSACQSEAPAAPEPVTATAVPTPTSQPATKAAAPTAPNSPTRQLAAMDTRRPVPLIPMMAWHQKQNMMEHLVAVERITDALSREDWAAVAKASAAIESSPQMQQQCQHMGAGVDGFTELALDFHKRADQIAVAAQTRDAPQVLRALSHTMQACTQCHATYRQDVVDMPTWQARTGASQTPTGMHH